MSRAMRSLSAVDVLRAWELCQTQHAVERALTLLALGTGLPRSRLAALPIGQRDALLISLREATLGAGMEGIAECPECAQRVEMAFSAGDIRTSDPAQGYSLALEEHGGEDSGGKSEEFGDYRLRYRLPNSEDLIALLEARNAQEAHQILLRRCVIEVRNKDAACDPADLPREVFVWLSERIARADPQADILLDLACPSCGHHWQAVFDISLFFWVEIDALSKRLLFEVHALAGAYGWSEAQILDMTAARRGAYLEMVLG